MGMKGYVLDNGSLLMAQSFITWKNHQGTSVPFPVYAVSIDHPDARVLIDTGFDKDLAERELPFETPEQSEEQTIPARRAKIGVTSGNFDIVSNSHLHMDSNGRDYLRHVATHEEMSSTCIRCGSVSTPDWCALIHG